MRRINKLKQCMIFLVCILFFLLSVQAAGQGVKAMIRCSAPDLVDSQSSNLKIVPQGSFESLAVMVKIGDVDPGIYICNIYLVDENDNEPYPDSGYSKEIMIKVR